MNAYREASKAFESASRDGNDEEFVLAAAHAFIAFVNVTHSRLVTPKLLTTVISDQLDTVNAIVAVVSVADEAVLDPKDEPSGDTSIASVDSENTIPVSTSKSKTRSK